MRGEDLTGRRFGRLTVIGAAPPYISPNWVYHGVCLCRCDCGNEVRVRRDHLRGGSILSCGCLKEERARERMKKWNAGRRTGT